jgi:putative salt-induced outer membrane protein YdiY
MQQRCTLTCALLVNLLCIGRAAFAQAPPQPPPPVWETQLGASFVGTTGNSETSTLGGDFSARRTWPVWQIESAASAVRTTDRGTQTAERYVASARGRRKLTALLSFAVGERIERDRFAGIDLRSLSDAGLTWALVRAPRWTLEGLTSFAWLHESRVDHDDKDDPTGIFQAVSRVPFGTSGDTTQRLTWFPNFEETAAYRTELELAAQAALNNRLALKIGYLLRYANDPVPGFLKTDSSTTASVVVRWRSTATLPQP